MPQTVSLPSRPVPPIERHRRRPPPRLRTKTGCLTCKHMSLPTLCPAIIYIPIGRQRRKKCDEISPACSGCTRNRLVCTWQTGESCDTSNTSDGVPSPPSQSSDTSLVSLNEGLGSTSISPFYETSSPQLAPSLLSLQTVFGLQSDQESHLLHHFMNHSLPTLIGNHAHPIFWEESLYLLSTMHAGPVRDAIFAISSRHLSNRKPEYGAQAIRYYSESVHLLREQVDGKVVDGFDDLLIMTVVWLYIFEVRTCTWLSVSCEALT